ncbi:MAG: hypothetical protein ACPLXO_04230, partial [Desulfurella sp.]
NDYPNYKRIIQELGKYEFTFNVKEILRKLKKDKENDFFELTIDANAVKIDNEVIECEPSEYPFTQAKFTISDRLMITGLKMLNSEKAKFVFENTRVVGLITDSSKYIMMAKDKCFYD